MTINDWPKTRGHLKYTLCAAEGGEAYSLASSAKNSKTPSGDNLIPIIRRILDGQFLEHVEQRNVFILIAYPFPRTSELLGGTKGAATPLSTDSLSDTVFLFLLAVRRSQIWSPTTFQAMG